MGEGKGKAILLAAVDYSQTIHILQVPETKENQLQVSWYCQGIPFFGTILQNLILSSYWKPHSVVKVVLVISLGAILIWLYDEKQFMKDIEALPAMLSTKKSMWWRGKSSLGHALFKSLKSTHILTFPSFLGTSTTLAIDLAWCMGLMNCLVTPSLIFKSHLVLFLHNFCLMGTMWPWVSMWC